MIAFAIGLITGLFVAFIILFLIGAAKLNEKYDRDKDHLDHMVKFTEMHEDDLK